MRIVVIIDETRFYHPDFMADLLRQTTDEIVGAALVVEIPAKNNIESYLKRNWRQLRWREMAELFLRKQWYLWKDLCGQRRRDGRFYSVRSVLKCFEVPFIEIRQSINQRKYLDWIAAKRPEVMLSSNSLIFGQSLLNLPSRACLNRHSALLPAYGGLWPVFQAYRSGEDEVGVSVQLMEQAIDEGAVLAQQGFAIDSRQSLAEIYQKCFAISAGVVLEALEKIRRDDRTPLDNGRSRSYFSFPTKQHWKEFRARGGRFV